jgi:hypothetical protein
MESGLDKLRSPTNFPCWRQSVREELRSSQDLGPQNEAPKKMCKLMLIRRERISVRLQFVRFAHSRTHSRQSAHWTGTWPGLQYPLRYFSSVKFSASHVTSCGFWCLSLRSLVATIRNLLWRIQLTTPVRWMCLSHGSRTPTFPLMHGNRFKEVNRPGAGISIEKRIVNRTTILDSYSYRLLVFSWQIKKWLYWRFR